jgi:hypothetical protein
MSRRKQKEPEADAPAGSLPDGICVAGHPRSAGAVRRAKGWGGLVGAVLCTALALGAHLPLIEALLRGLAGGVVGYVVLWALALAVARQFVIAEVRARYAEVKRAAAGAASDD